MDTVVIHNGSGNVKAGLAGDSAPTSFPSVVGRPRFKVNEDGVSIRPTGREQHFGEEASQRRGILTLKYPVEHGIVTNWEDMEPLWRYTFTEVLKVDVAEHPLLMTEPPLNPRANREKMTQVMFETFGVPALYVANTAVLSLIASSKTTGTNVYSGDGVTMTVPVYEGHCLPHAIVKGTIIAGRDITDRMMSLLSERGYSLTTTSDREIARTIKEKFAFVAQDYDQELRECKYSSVSNESYTLPNGDTCIIGSERFRCAEAMFRPSLVGMEVPGIHETLYNTIRRCDKDIRRDLFANIILSGGNTSYPGMVPRLRKELTKLTLNATPGSNDAIQGVHIWQSENPRDSAWLGGAVLSTRSSFGEMCMKRDEYDEFGPALVHLKCF